MTLLSRSDWLAARRSGLGSSDAAAVLGLSPWKTPLHVYLDKIGELPDADSEPKRWGRRLEAVVAEGYTEETGDQLLDPPAQIVRHPVYPWLIASLDRVTQDGTPVEIKVVSHAGQQWGPAPNGDVPDHYLIQVQHQLAVTGRSAARIAALFGGTELRVYEIPANLRLVGLIVAKCKEFWANHVLAMNPPRPDFGHSTTPDLVRKIWSNHWDEREVVLPAEFQEIAKSYLTASEIAANANREKDRLRAILVDAMQGANTAHLLSGEKITRRKVTRASYTVPETTYDNIRVFPAKEGK